MINVFLTVVVCMFFSLKRRQLDFFCGLSVRAAGQGPGNSLAPGPSGGEQSLLLAFKQEMYGHGQNPLTLR